MHFNYYLSECGCNVYVRFYVLISDLQDLTCK